MPLLADNVLTQVQFWMAGNRWLLLYKGDIH